MSLRIKIGSTIAPLLIVSLLAGAIMGAAACHFLYQDQLERAALTQSGLIAFNTIQSQELARHTLDQAMQSKPQAPASAAVAAYQPSNSNAANETKPKAINGPQPALIVAPPPKTPASAALANAPSVAEIKPKTMTGPPPAPPARVMMPQRVMIAPSIKPPPHQIETPMAFKRVEGNRSDTSTKPSAAPTPQSTINTPESVTMEQAGITGIDSNSVRFKSGRQILVGSEFGSGEKLISVNPADGKIITDRRTIHLAKPPPEQ